MIGSSYACYNLALSLAKRGHQVSVICPSARHYSYHDKIDTVSIFRIFSLSIPYIKTLRISMFPLTIPKIIKTISPDIIHIQHPFFIGRKSLTYAKSLGFQ
ncbi:MAG: glycosyltransferase [Actinobacteria bacterium]|nr:glycosyltransferase [Actinomycetota bacterium]